MPLMFNQQYDILEDWIENWKAHNCRI